MKLAISKKRLALKVKRVNRALKVSPVLSVPRSSNRSEVLQTWLLRTGASPEAGLPASHIGIYTDFN